MSKKFTAGDKIDRLLTTVIAHEFSRTNECFDAFVNNENRRLSFPKSKKLKISSYNFYGDFLCHLYEFYVGCFKRDYNSIKDIKGHILDELFTHEAQKLMDMIASSIENGTAPDWENDVSVYKVIVPANFGKHFRWLRNRNSHTCHRRASGEDISMTDFYKKYHLFIYKLFSCAHWMWHTDDIEKHDFKDIENFCTSIPNKK